MSPVVTDFTLSLFIPHGVGGGARAFRPEWVQSFNSFLQRRRLIFPSKSWSLGTATFRTTRMTVIGEAHDANSDGVSATHGR
jgi:hypothetical protein